MDFAAGAYGQLKQDNGGTMRPAIFKTLLSAFFILLLCACQSGGGQADDPGQDRPAEVQQLIQAYAPTITDCAIEDAEFSLSIWMTTQFQSW